MKKQLILIVSSLILMSVTAMSNPVVADDMGEAEVAADTENDLNSDITTIYECVSAKNAAIEHNNVFIVGIPEDQYFEPVELVCSGDSNYAEYKYMECQTDIDSIILAGIDEYNNGGDASGDACNIKISLSAFTDITKLPLVTTTNIEKETNTYTEEDLERLARLIYFEAGSNWVSEKCKYYTGSVVLNRFNSDKYPNTIEEVIAQSGQYAVAKFYMQNSVNEEAYKVCVRIASELLENGSVLPEEVVYQAQFKQGSAVYAYLDGLYFCY